MTSLMREQAKATVDFWIVLLPTLGRYASRELTRFLLALQGPGHSLAALAQSWSPTASKHSESQSGNGVMCMCGRYYRRPGWTIMA